MPLGDSRTAPAPSTVDLRALDICRGFLQPVPLADVKPTDDARVAFAHADAVAITANGRLVNGDKCVGDVRRRYAPKAPKQGGKR